MSQDQTVVLIHSIQEQTNLLCDLAKHFSSSGKINACLRDRLCEWFKVHRQTLKTFAIAEEQKILHCHKQELLVAVDDVLKDVFRRAVKDSERLIEELKKSNPSTDFHLY